MYYCIGCHSQRLTGTKTSKTQIKSTKINTKQVEAIDRTVSMIIMELPTAPNKFNINRIDKFLMKVRIAFNTHSRTRTVLVAAFFHINTLFVGVSNNCELMDIDTVRVLYILIRFTSFAFYFGEPWLRLSHNRIYHGIIRFIVFCVCICKAWNCECLI